MDVYEVEAWLEARGYIAYLWSIEDVKELRPDLTDEECMAVLKKCQFNSDADIGMNWDILRSQADELFPEEEQP